MIENLRLTADCLMHLGGVVLALWCVIGIIVIPVLAIRAIWKETHHED